MATLALNTSTNRTGQSTRGSKFYELSNHLGNVPATVSDMKLGYVTSLGQTTAEGYKAQVQSASDYFPFGWAMSGRQYSTDSYRFGFNGKENDTHFGDQIIQDYGFRLYNPAIGKFLSVDPLAPEYPWNSTYAFAENDVIRAIDLEGLERAIKINYFDANGNIGRTRLITVTDNQTGNLVNLQARLNGVPISGNPEILEINKPDPFIPNATLTNAITGSRASDNRSIGTAGNGAAPLITSTPFESQVLARTPLATVQIDNLQGATMNNTQTTIRSISSISQVSAIGTPNTYTFPGSDIPDPPQGLVGDTYNTDARELPRPILAQFQGNSALFLNRTQALNSIQGTSAFLRNWPNESISLTGNLGYTTASGGRIASLPRITDRKTFTDEFGTRVDGREGGLMLSRARAVRNLMISPTGGINQRQITNLNAGTITRGAAGRNVGVSVDGN